MFRSVACTSFLFVVPFLVACGPGAADPQSSQAVSAISFGDQTFQVPPGTVVGCQVAYCLQGSGCQACTGATGGCAWYAACVAPAETVMGAGELCSADGCIPNGCFPAYCTAAGLCTVCDDGDPTTVDECSGDPANPCSHVPTAGPDAVGGTDAGEPAPLDAVIVADLPSGSDPSATVDARPTYDVPRTPDAGAVEDVPSVPDAAAPDDPGQKGDEGSGPDCVEECVQKCQTDDQDCEKYTSDTHRFPLLPPGWMKAKKLHCDNGLHKGWLKGLHQGWGKMFCTTGETPDDEEPAPELTCEEVCKTTCDGDDDGEDHDGEDHDGKDDDKGCDHDCGKHHKHHGHGHSHF
jgi:hypothetical protein